MRTKIFIAVSVLTGLIVFHTPLLAEKERGCGNVARMALYGDDNRSEYCAADDVLKVLAESTVALFRSNDLVQNAKGGYFAINKTTLGQTDLLRDGQGRILREEERFLNQPAAAYCSGALVGPDLVMTAGHCVRHGTINPKKGEYCKDMKIAFGYRIERTGVNPSVIEKGEVYSCKETVAHVFEPGEGRDYAIIRLKRKVENHRGLAINRDQDLKEKTGLIVMGHPSGIPLKIADEAEVRSVNKDKGYFMANLDTFEGNSGSPVFNAKTLMIEGILVRGDEDYRPADEDTSRLRTSTYTYDGGDGEACTLISEVKAFVPVTQFERAILAENGKTDNLYDKMLREITARDIPAPYKDVRDIKAIPAVYYPEAQPDSLPVPQPEWI